MNEPQVRSELHELERYVQDVLGFLKPTPWRGADRSPTSSLDNENYAFIRAGSIEVDGLPTEGAGD